MNNIAIIQARMGSSRLPKKVLMEIEGKSLLEHQIDRLRHSKMLNEIIVVTTIEKSDLEIVKLCSTIGIRVCVGSVDDVLDRYYQCAKLLKPDNVVRITADCPLIDPSLVDRLIRIHLDKNNDYTSNTLKETFPDGLDAEVVKFSILERAWKESKLLSEREHVTPYIKTHSEMFKIENLECGTYLGDKRWTVDEPQDFEFIARIYEALYRGDQELFTTDEILAYLEKNSVLEDLNSNIVRNEGYYKSLAKDK